MTARRGQEGPVSPQSAGLVPSRGPGKPKFNVVAFGFGDDTFRALIIDDRPWFVAEDVFRCAGLPYGKRTVQQFPDDERREVDLDAMLMLVPNKKGLLSLLISEIGMHRVFFHLGSGSSSFKTYFFEQIMPGLGKGGQIDHHWETYRRKMDLVKQVRLTMGRKSAQQLMLDLDMPMIGRSQAQMPIEPWNIGSVRQFIGECLVACRHSETPSRILYQRYLVWLEGTEHTRLAPNAFGRMLVKAGLRRRKTDGGGVYCGVAPVPVGDQSVT